MLYVQYSTYVQCVVLSNRLWRRCEVQRRRGGRRETASVRRTVLYSRGCDETAPKPVRRGRRVREAGTGGVGVAGISAGQIKAEELYVSTVVCKSYTSACHEIFVPSHVHICTVLVCISTENAWELLSRSI
jgi:hypothetical protein